MSIYSLVLDATDTYTSGKIFVSIKEINNYFYNYRQINEKSGH